MSTPAHLLPQACYVCGGEPHDIATTNGTHTYWSNADAESYFAGEDAKTVPNFYDAAASYVETHRPY